MHSKIMRFLVDCSVVVGVIVAWLLAWSVGTAIDNTGVGVVVFIISFFIIECGLASEGMKVEQAENIAKIAYNTELLVNRQKSGSTGTVSSSAGSMQQNVTRETSMLSRAADGIKSGPTWTCSKCLEKNAPSSQFCMTCGNKKPYC